MLINGIVHSDDAVFLLQKKEVKKEMEEERMLMELSNAERWMYLNAKLIADKVLKTSDRKALIPKDAYDESLEDDLIALFFSPFIY